MKRTLFLAALSITGLMLPQLALAQFDLQRLIRLQSGNADAAYAYAEEHRAQQEGDPEFDFYYGMAAIDSGRASDGVFALERVLAVQPGNNAARLELARGYFILEEYARSRAEFETALAQKPPDVVRVKIERFLDAIRLKEGRYRTSGNGFVQLGVGDDSNINSAPDNAQLSNGIVLNEDSVETGDAFTSLIATGRLNVPLTPASSFFASATADVKAHVDEDQFDNHTLSLQAGATVREGTNSYQAELQLQSFVFDGDDFRDLTALNLSWRTRTSQRDQFSVFGQLATLDYPDQEIRDSTLLIAGAGYTGQLGGSLSPVWFASVYLGDEDPDDSSEDARAVAERSFFGARLGTQLNVGGRSTLLLALSLQASEYGAEDPIEQQKREDTFTALDADYTWLVNRTFSVRGGVGYSDNDSNIEVSEFSRTVIDLSLRAEFN